MAAIAQLKAVLGLDPKAYKSGVREAESATSKLRSGIASVGRSLAGAFSVGMIVAATKKLVDFASEIRHTADNLNVTTDSLQALNATGLKYGLSVESLTKLLGKLRQSQGKVVEGDKEYTDSLKLLNIEAEKFGQANTADALVMIAEAYVRAGGDAEAFSAVQDLLGRAGKNATAMLEELASKGLRGVTEEAKKAGQVIQDELITKLELLGTRMEQFSLKAKVGFAQGLNWVSTKVAEAGAFWGHIAGVGIKGQAWAAAAAMNDATAKPSVAAGSAASAKRSASGSSAPSESMPDLGSAHIVAWQKWKDGQSSKSARVKESYQKRIQDIMERELSATGRGQNVDSLASVGGFIGPSRPGLGIADRQLKLQQESARVQVEIKKLTSEMRAELAAINANTQPGGLP